MFIVIEGIDGAGCETQARNLFHIFKKNQRSPILIKYPDYRRNIGQIIKEFLYQIKISPLSSNFCFILFNF